MRGRLTFAGVLLALAFLAPLAATSAAPSSPIEVLPTTTESTTESTTTDQAAEVPTTTSPTTTSTIAASTSTAPTTIASSTTTTVASTTTTSTPSAPASATDQVAPASATVPSAPRSLAAAAGPRSVDLAWLPPATDGGAPVDRYLIYRSTSASGPFSQLAQVTGRSFTFNGLTVGTRFYFRVFAHNEIGWSAMSNTVSAVPAAALPAAVPSPPRSVRATASGNTIVLSWQPPASGLPIDRYIVWRAFGAGPFVVVSEPTTTSATFANMLPGTRFYLRVFAHNARGWSAMSSTVSALTAGVPDAPRDLWATVASESVVLRWDDISIIGFPKPTGFSVQREIAGSWTTIAAIGPWFSVYTVTGLTNGTTYRFRVIARNDNGISPPSDVVSARPIAPPSAPQSLTSRWEEDGQLTLSWLPPETDNGYPITGYLAAWWDGSRWAPATAVTTATTVTFSVSGISNVEGRTFRVTARNIWGSSSSSNWVKPGAPTAGPT